ncbi:MAG TPA: histone deacetylase [Dongiaceae bacterium]|nr:histone deacetylase [Dongiaceae bacterium]
MSRPLHVWTSHHHPVPLPRGHRFPIGKHAPLIARLLAEGVVRAEDVHPAEPTPIEWLALAHDREYLARALERGLDPADERRLGLPWSPALGRRARAAVDGTVRAAFAALEHGVAGNLAGGGHHAFRDHGEAYCLLNDVAVAIAVLRAHGHARRPFVADLDVHQGNGTAVMFADDPSVFTFSIHAGSNYPLHKARGSLDVALPDRTGDDAYLAALDKHLPAALERHAPDLVFYQAGVDALAADRLGRLALSHAGLAERDARLFAACTGLPVVVTLGGGYSDPLDASIEAHAAVWRAARRARDRRPVAGPARPVHPGDALPTA